MKRGEGIIGDFRACRRNGAQKGRFAGIGKSKQPGIGDQLQAEPDPHFLTRFAGLRLARRPVRRGFEKGVSLSAGTALGKNEFLPLLGEVGQHRLLIVGKDLRSHRKLQCDRLP